MKFIAPSIILFLLSIVTVAQTADSDMDMAHINTSDISRFWRAFDKLGHQTTTADSLSIIKAIIADSASDGLKQYMAAANCNENCFLEAIRTKKKQYLTVRTQTLDAVALRGRLATYLVKFRAIYPAFKTPDICLSIGKFEVGGTQFGKSLYIGCEMDAAHNMSIVAQVIHEVAHYQQTTPDPQTNLANALVEGGAEFMCYKVTGLRTITKAWVYGKAHEQALWQQFKPILDSPIDAHWFLDIPDKNKPGSMAYFIGFRICEAYLAHVSDKQQALMDITEMADPAKIYRESQYKGH